MKDCQAGEDGETPVLTFDNGDLLEAGLLVTLFENIFLLNKNWLNKNHEKRLIQWQGWRIITSDREFDPHFTYETIFLELFG